MKLHALWIPTINNKLKFLNQPGEESLISYLVAAIIKLLSDKEVTKIRSQENVEEKFHLGVTGY